MRRNLEMAKVDDGAEHVEDDLGDPCGRRQAERYGDALHGRRCVVRCAGMGYKVTERFDD